jgi:site-specific recombinase XerD
VQIDEAIGQFLTGYFSTCCRSAKTQTAYKIDLAQFQQQFATTGSLQSIEPDALERWAKELRSQEYAPASIRRKFATLRVFFSYCVRKRILESSPLWRIRLDLEREVRLPRNLSAADAKRLLDQAWAGVRISGQPTTDSINGQFLAFRNLTIIELFFATGMRVGELVALSLPDWREDDVSFLVKGKGSRQRLAMLPDERSASVIKKYLANRSSLALSHDAFVVNARGNRLSTQGVARMLAQTAEKAGITTRVTPHMLRHTVGTLLLTHGADIRVVQEVLGHASITMTERYTHVSKEHLRKTLRACHPNHYLAITCNAANAA